MQLYSLDQCYVIDDVEATSTSYKNINSPIMDSLVYDSSFDFYAYH